MPDTVEFCPYCSAPVVLHQIAKANPEGIVQIHTNMGPLQDHVESKHGRMWTPPQISLGGMQ
jgi:hypothetical protein